MGEHLCCQTPCPVAPEHPCRSENSEAGSPFDHMHGCSHGQSRSRLRMGRESSGDMIARLRGQEDGENCNACPSLISDPSAADLVCLCTLPPSVMLCNIWTFDFIRLLHVCMRMPCPGGELGCGPLLEVIDHLQVDHSRTDHPSHSSAPLNVHTVEEGSTFPNGIGSCHSLSKATMVSPCPHSFLRLHPHGLR